MKDWELKVDLPLLSKIVFQEKSCVKTMKIESYGHARVRLKVPEL